MLDKLKKMIKGKDLPVDKKEIDKKDVEVVEQDDTYLQYSSEAVGYNTRESQWDVYKSGLQYIPVGSSILDFGCGRGDLHVMHLSEYGEVDYTGIDMNEPLINAGKIIDPKRDMILSDWFELPLNVTKDWCVNIGSCNLRYDADMTRDDFKYLCDTIDKMYMHAINGIVVLISYSEGLIQHDPGKILNWSKDKFKNVILDHSVSDDGFCLIIKK